MSTLTYLITHAHTAQDPDHDSRTWALSEIGRQQADLLATQAFWSSVTHVLVSSEAKTYLTVEPTITARCLPVTVDAKFDELRRPGWAENYTARVSLAFRHPHRSAGTWEQAAQALARFLEGAEAACRQYEGRNLAIVGHGLMMSLYMAYAAGQRHVELDDWRDTGFAAVAIVDLERSKVIQGFQNSTIGPKRG